ncbi:MAG TPA: threonine synthase [Terriglobales bacterium]|nr:threonine synthase [Terriglobales bacterium]
MSASHALRCIGCGAESEHAGAEFRCPGCGDLLEVVYPGWAKSEAQTLVWASQLKAVWRERRLSFQPQDASGVWRFRELLPRVAERAISLREGNTPVFELPGSASSAGVERLLAKHQGMNPTGSFKDTGMTVAISVARQEGFSWVACASTGNTSASMAAYAAQGGLRSLVLIPSGKIAWGKLSQALDYGALTCQLDTDFDGCLRILTELVQRHPIYLLNSINPYRLEGQKTAAIELLEQLDWQVPDHIIVPGGNLGNCSALGKGLEELRRLELISKLPKISVIQAEGANALVRTMREAAGKRLVAVQAETAATAIRIGNPVSWKKAVRVLESTGGHCEQVSEAQIAVAKAEIGRDGVGCEPASAVTLAGLKKLVRQGFVQRQDQVVLILTGHLLKDPEYTLKYHRRELMPDAGEGERRGLDMYRRAPLEVEAKVEAVLRVLEQAEKSNGAK